MKTPHLTKTVLAVFALLITSCGSASATRKPPVTQSRVPSDSSSQATPVKPNVVGPTFLVSGDGLDGAHFGQSISVVMAELTKVLGQLSRLTSVLPPSNCSIDSYSNWRAGTLYFEHNRFVGYATGNLIGENRQIPNAITAKGLKIGSTVAQARMIYKGSFHTSYAQGGSWDVTTSNGKLAGFLTEEVNHTNPPPQIADITAGSVGCPAVTP